VLAVPGAVASVQAAAIHGFNQVVLALLLVWVAAAWASSGGVDRPAPARRAGLATLLGLGVAVVLGAPASWLAVHAVEAARALAGHAAPRFDDGQGALGLMLAYELGLAAALLVAVAPRAPWRRKDALLAGGGLVALHAVVVLLCDELVAHAGFAPGAREIRAASVLLALSTVFLLTRRGASPPSGD